MATMTPTEFAVTVDSDGRTVRKFLRSITPKEDQPGKGSRWVLKGDKKSVTRLTKQFADWTAKQEAAAQKRREDAAAADATDEVEETEDA
mgnify:CR=1 FL=1